MDIYEKIKDIWDLLEIRKLDNDIIEGINIANEGNIQKIENYVLKIQKDYSEYIDVYNAIQRVKRNLSGYCNNQQIPITNNINSYIALLQDIKDAKVLKKIYNEIFK